jgi:uncharacterized protein YjbJ (UPF0337 family)
MNKDTVKGNMKELRGTIKAKWGKLTDNDLTEVEGNMEVLSGKVQKAYGKSKEDAEREVKEFKKSLPSKGCC